MDKYITFSDPSGVSNTWIEGTAIACCDLIAGERQYALLERSVCPNGDISDNVWFGVDMPAGPEDVDYIYESAVSESDDGVIASFSSEVRFRDWDWCGGELTGK